MAGSPMSARPAPEQRRRIDGLKWQQSMRFGDYVVRGVSSMESQEWKAKLLPQDLSGKRVLDIGAADGFFSFLAEERGARRVVGIDKPKRWREEVGQQTFDVAREIYGSEVEYRILDAVDVDQLGETFDVVFFLGTYYHLGNPILALEKIHDLLASPGVVYLEGDIIPGVRPVLRYFGPTWCAGTLSFFEMVGRRIGYDRVTLLAGTWQIPVRWRLYRDAGRGVVDSALRVAAYRAMWDLHAIRTPIHRVMLRLDKR
jgi:SAM-dependent methyltransferase